MRPAGQQIVQAAIDGSKTPGQKRIGDEVVEILSGGLRFGDLDLRQNELEIVSDEYYHLPSPLELNCVFAAPTATFVETKT